MVLDLLAVARVVVATVRAFLEADLIDTMHFAVAPVEFGHGERLWTSPDELTDRFHLERTRLPRTRSRVPLVADIGEVLAALQTLLERLEKEERPPDPVAWAKLHTAFDALGERLQQEARRRGLRLPDSSDDAGQGDRPA